MEENYFWSARESGFYPESMKTLYEDSPDGWPDDAVKITEEIYNSLLAGQLNGKVITSDSNGNPILTEPVIDWSQKAELRRQSLLSSANARISLWQTKLLAGRELTDEQKTALNVWLDYMDKLETLNFSSIDSKEDYDGFDWPILKQ